MNYDGSIINGDLATFINTANIDTTYMKWDNSTGKLKVDTAAVAGLAMPSDKYIDLTLGATGTTYTAPANGWFVVSKRSTKTNEILELSLTATKFGFKYASTGAQGCFVSCPVKKGDKIACGYTTTGATQFFRFIYAEGAVPANTEPAS